MDIKQKIENANKEAALRLSSGDPVLVDIAPAGDVIPGLDGKMITHAGPPIEWGRMCGAQQGAIIGMVIYEGWAESAEEAKALLDKGEIQLESNHDHSSVGPMAGTISPSAPVWVVENRAFGNRAYCRQVEGRQQFGENSQGALEGLRLWRDVWAPTLRRLFITFWITTGHDSRAVQGSLLSPGDSHPQVANIVFSCPFNTPFGI